MAMQPSCAQRRWGCSLCSLRFPKGKRLFGEKEPRTMKVWPALNDIARVAVAMAAVLAILELADAMHSIAFELGMIGRELRGIQHAISAPGE
jgi:hypothetical protein